MKQNQLSTIIQQKVYSIITTQLKKHIPPTINLKTINKLDLQLIKHLKSQYGIAGIILSNGYDSNVKKFANNIGIEYIGYAHKPIKKYLLNACDKMGLEPENVLVIGDNIINDIYGGNRCGMITAIVDSVEQDNDMEL